MLSEPEQQPRSIPKNPLLYSSIVVGIAALAVAWIFFSRWQESRLIEHRAAQQRAEKQREEDPAALHAFGGKELAIQNFYAIPGAIHRGQKTQLCYGVANATTVKLEPQSNPVWLRIRAASRCRQRKPRLIP